MPDVTISIGERNFTVSCQEGEESFLHAAAALLDREAQNFSGQAQRLTPERMLLMSGLLLADKGLAQDEKIAGLEAKLAQKDALIADLESRPVPEPERIEVTVEVPVEVEVERFPAEAAERLASIADQAETFADRLEESDA